VEKSLKDETRKQRTQEAITKVVVVTYAKGLSEAFARILKSHGIAIANHPHRTLRNFVVHLKDKVSDEEKTELMCRVPYKYCSSSYIGETGRKFGLRIKQHKKEYGLFHRWNTDPSLHVKREQCNLHVSHHKPCRGREPCHRLGQGNCSRQRGLQRQTR